MTALLDTCPRCGSSAPSGRLSACPACLLAATQAEVLPELPGLVCESLLGRGGMGEVYRAEHVALSRPVAVKILCGELVQNRDFRARFEREARLLAALDHPNIVRVFDYGVSRDEEPYISMELVEGGNLADHIPMPSLRALGLVTELALALEHAHARGVVHCDIKPENVLIDVHGHVRLSDFGIARLVNRPDAAATRTSRVLGTPSYMAPEAIAGRAPDPRMDVYSVGVLLSEMVTGTARLPPSERSMPEAMYAFVRRATDPNIEARFADMRALRQELAALENELKGGALAPAGLSADEQSWLRGVALLLATASAAVLYAGLVSFSPRVMEANEPLPFIAFGAQRAADGRVATIARFEALPTLGAAFSVAIALFAYALLRRHWRRSGLEVVEPDRPLRAPRVVLWMGYALIALFVLREALESFGFQRLAAYVPVLGGTMELILLWFVWSAVLEAVRVSRPLSREPRLWFGFGLGLIPPLLHFLRLVSAAG
ncbi:MAG: protein kinase domain-containing protein [Myxococcota bacterium]